MDATPNLSTLLDAIVARLGRGARALLWSIAALVCAIVASVLGLTALIVSLWNASHLLALVVPAIVFAVLAALFGVVATRTLRAQRAAAAVTGPALQGPAAPDAHPSPTRRHHPLTWLVALGSLLLLGGSRELLALRLRALLGLIAHAVHVLRLFSRRGAPPLP